MYSLFKKDFLVLDITYQSSNSITEEIDKFTVTALYTYLSAHSQHLLQSASDLEFLIMTNLAG